MVNMITLCINCSHPFTIDMYMLAQCTRQQGSGRKFPGLLPHSFLGSSDRSLQSLTESHTLELSMHSPFLHKNFWGPSHLVAVAEKAKTRSAPTHWTSGTPTLSDKQHWSKPWIQGRPPWPRHNPDTGPPAGRWVVPQPKTEAHDKELNVASKCPTSRSDWATWLRADSSISSWSSLFWWVFWEAGFYTRTT